MKSILDKIITVKRREVEVLKKIKPISQIQKNSYFHRETLSLSDSILKEDTQGIIAEFKRRSPSGGILNEHMTAPAVTSGYLRAGASAVSVLTDREFFGGDIRDITDVRSKTGCPVLRKDFIIDEYQVLEAKAAGADAILLIAEVLDRKVLLNLHRLAASLGLEVLVEVHDRKNLDKIPAEAIMVGINSRDLSKLSVSHENSEKLIKLLPPLKVIVAESGIRSVSDYKRLQNAGFNGFLIGEYFMRNPDPPSECLKFISEIRDAKNKY
jgi:indole-3-glycerol phosphate synthase